MKVERVLWLVVLVCGLMAAGCGKGESGGAKAAGDEKSGGGAAAAPAAGGGGNNELVGSWFHTNKQMTFLGDGIDGLEFLKDGKVILYNGQGTSMSWTYTLLDGGRMTLTQIAGGLTEAFKVTVNATSLKLVPDDEPGVTYEYRKLKGQSVPDASKEAAGDAAKRQASAGDAVRDVVKKENLVMAGGGAAMALKREGEGWVAYVGGARPMMRKARVTVDEGGRALVELGPVVGPPGEPQVEMGQMTFAASGQGGELMSGSMALKSDAGTYAGVMKEYEDARAKREAVVEEFGKMFGAYARLEGDVGAAGQVQRVGLALVRVVGKPAFIAADLGQTPNPPVAAFKMPAVMEYREGKVVLVMGQQNVFEGVTEGGKAALKGMMNGRPVTLGVVETLTTDQIKERRAVVAEFLDKQLKAGVSLSGRVMIDAAPPYPEPIHFEVQSGDKKSVTGTACLLEYDGAYAVSGPLAETVFGVSMNLKSTAVTKQGRSPAFPREMQFVIDASWVGAGPKISGHVYGFEGGVLDLAVVTDSQLQQDLQKVRSALAGGVTFVEQPRSIVSRGKYQFAVKADAAGGGISGDMSTVPGSTRRPDPPAKIDGTLGIDNGFVAMKVQHDAPTAGGLFKSNYELYFLFDDGAMRPLGWALPAGVNPPTVSPFAMAAAK